MPTGGNHELLNQQQHLMARINNNKKRSFRYIPVKTAKKNKYNAQKTIIDGVKFDSKKEGQQYKQFCLLKKAAKKEDRVVKIELQKRYDIIVNNKKICFYKLDFLITYADNTIRYFDTKGHKYGAGYQIFKLKKKLVEAIYNINIEEI